jgi:ABC-type uncharacterized transport system substrate-binding protein
MTGKMATEILGGVDPATIPIPDKIPQKLVVNRQALKGLKDPWKFPEDIMARADVVVDETGKQQKEGGAKGPQTRIFKPGLA